MVSDLHQRLKDAAVQGKNGKIDLFQRFADINQKAPTWLANHGKNGIEHSERLEEYLVKLTQKPSHTGRISTGEIFILLCAAYLHDIGYWHNEKLDPVDHPQRSHDRILADPAEYLLGDFPQFGGAENLVAKAIAMVCRGHSDEKFVPLNEMPKEFADQNLCVGRPMNLRMLAALLRLADETDDPYVRMVDGSFHALRSNTPLVVVGDETIAWHWKDSGDPTPDRFLKNLEEKKTTLWTATEYLREIKCSPWYLVLHPQVPGSAPFMAENPTETFVGREDDLAKIHDIIQTRRIEAVTGVVGTGGIGKTELARMYAERYQAEYPGGIFWASLKGSSWKSEAPKILTELRPGADPVAFVDDNQARVAVTKTLDRKHALLVIDNVEEYDDIIKPACRVLVTTRNKDAFGTVPHAAVHRLDKLNIEAALELLSKLLGPVRVAQDLTGAEQLVKILGSMPLALEIAARHLADIPDFSFPDYIGRIRNRLDLLAVEHEEDKNVLASLELSLDGLKELKDGAELLDLFFASAVCAATGFTSDTLIAAAGLEDMEPFETKKLVGKLHQRSLLEYHEEIKRYSLHALVRQLAETKLLADQERWKRYTQNHFDHFDRYAFIYQSDSAKILKEKDGLWKAMVQTNQLQELRGRFPRLLEVMVGPYKKMITNEDYESSFRYIVKTDLINIDELGKYEALLTLLDPLAENINKLSVASQGWVFNNMGRAYASLGQYKTAIECFMKGLAVSNQIGNITGISDALGNMGASYLQLGEYLQAMECYGKQLTIIRRIGNVRDEGNTLSNIGVLYAYTDQYQAAIDHCQRAIDIARRKGDQNGEASALGNMGLVYQQLGRPQKALDLNTQALEKFRRIGNIRGEGNSLGNIGVVYAGRGQLEMAIRYYNEQLDIVRWIGDLRGESNALGNLGLAYVNLRRHESGIEYLNQALPIARQIGDLKGECADLGNLGVAYTRLGQNEKALGHFLEAKAIANRIGDVQGEANALVNMGVTYARLRNKALSRECFEASIAKFKGLGLDHMVVQVQRMMEESLNTRTFVQLWRWIKLIAERTFR